MKLWKDNRLDQEYELSNGEIARRFMESDFYKKRLEDGYFLDMALVRFMTAKEGLSSSWEFDESKGSVDGSPDMTEILRLVEKVKK